VLASADLARAQRVADRLRTGIVHINDQTVLNEVYGPIGGIGVSGNGFNHPTLTNAAPSCTAKCSGVYRLRFSARSTSPPAASRPARPRRRRSSPRSAARRGLPDPGQ
jgi:hypothetical protein